MNEGLKTCDRCGSRLERGSVQIAIRAAGEPGSGEIPPSLDACRACSKSFARWVDRGRSRTRAAKKPKVPRPEKKSHRRGKYRPTRQQMALVVVIGLCLMFCYYLSRSFSE